MRCLWENTEVDLKFVRQNKLILYFLGKVMTDETKLSEYNIDEKKFIVVMVLQPKSESTPSAVASEPQQNTVQPSSPVAQSASTASSTSAVKVEPSALSGESTTPKETQSAFVAAESNLVFGDEYEKSIKQIMEMGYERKQVEKAMKASFNNPERAVEYLISGLPVSGLDDDSASVASADMASNATSGENVSTNESNPLEFLRSQPVFNQMRQIIQQNPQVLNSLMQQIGQSNPQLLQLITQNQGSFVRMLNEPDPSGQPVTAEGNPPASGRTQQGSIPGLEELIGFAQITPQDKEAIERVSIIWIEVRSNCSSLEQDFFPLRKMFPSLTVLVPPCLFFLSY